ncbi:hypothetical protein KM043_017484 [Ampulex compressa]|nr:hypothetical protein KM043_017484 [Ampulex compressa]
MVFLRISVLLIVLGCCTASPIRFEAYFVPIVVDDSNSLQDPSRNGLASSSYVLLPDVQVADSGTEDSQQIRKRSTGDADLEDLETAAGTNALRPLFVYRQQVAYRQRIREAIRRGFRF